MPTQRHLRADELLLLRVLLERCSWSVDKIENIQSLLIEDMSDGGMGSIRFVSADDRFRKLSHVLVEAEFDDTDGVLVSVALNLDNYGELFELDIWKVDNTKLLKFPMPSNITIKRK